MAGILDSSGGIWSFRQKVALFEQALNQEKRELLVLSDEVEYQINNVTVQLNQAAVNSECDDSERRKAQELLDDIGRAREGYRSAREEVFRLIDADSSADSSQSAQEFLARLGRALDVYYGFDGHSASQAVSSERIETDAVSEIGNPEIGWTTLGSDAPKALNPDKDAWFKQGVSAVEQRVEAYRDVLRDKGYSESEIRSMSDAEYGRIMHDEFGPDFSR